jgi:hypothetical protein
MTSDTWGVNRLKIRHLLNQLPQQSSSNRGSSHPAIASSVCASYFNPTDLRVALKSKILRGFSVVCAVSHVHFARHTSLQAEGRRGKHCGLATINNNRKYLHFIIDR